MDVIMTIDVMIMICVVLSIAFENCIVLYFKVLKFSARIPTFYVKFCEKPFDINQLVLKLLHSM